jgi:hypothetical protein
MIGEAAILQAFGAYDDGGDEAVCRAFSQAGQQVAASVIRTAQDFAGARYKQPLAWLEALTEHRAVGLDQLMIIANQLPEDSLALLAHGAKITRTITDGLREKVEAGAHHHLANLAVCSSNLAVRLGALGDREAALGPAKEAVDLYGALAAQAPDAYRPDLATSLSNLAMCLSAVGRRQGALAQPRRRQTFIVHWPRRPRTPTGPIWRCR